MPVLTSGHRKPLKQKQLERELHACCTKKRESSNSQPGQATFNGRGRERRGKHSSCFFERARVATNLVLNTFMLHNFG